MHAHMNELIFLFPRNAPIASVGFVSGACGGDLCRKRPWAALCQSQLSPATSGTGDSNAWYAKTAARQVSLRHPSSKLFMKNLQPPR